MVVFHGLPRRLAPWMPWARISRSTRPRPTCSPARDERLPHPPRSVGVVVGRVQLADPRQQPLVLDRSGRALAGGALVVGGRRHAQDPADGLDTEAAAVLVDVAAHFGRSASSSFAKNTEADFRISFARRNSKISRRSLRISSRSAGVGRSGRVPLSASACRTRLRNTSGLIPRSRPYERSVAPIPTPDAHLAPSTPRGTSSSRHRREHLLSPGHNPGSRPPRNPGRLSRCWRSWLSCRTSRRTIRAM